MLPLHHAPIFNFNNFSRTNSIIAYNDDFVNREIQINRKTLKMNQERADIHRLFHAEGGTRTRTLLRAGDFKSPVSAIPPLQRTNDIISKEDRKVNRKFNKKRKRKDAD